MTFLSYSLVHTPMIFSQDIHTDESFETMAGIEIAAGRLRQRPAALHLLHGHSSVYAGSLLIGAATNQAVAVIDGATRFNSYTLARIAAVLQRPPKVLLQQTYVTRAFTAFQTEAAITRKLVRFLETVPCRLVVVLGLLHTYYDEQVSAHECRQSLERIVQTFRTLTHNNIHILVADVTVDPPPGKETLFQFLSQAADIVACLSQDGVTIEHSRTIPQQGVSTDGSQQRYLYTRHRPEQGGME